MRNLAVLFFHFIATLAWLLGPSGVRSLVAEPLLLKHQLLIVNRSRQRSPNLPSSERTIACQKVMVKGTESGNTITVASVTSASK